MLKTIGLVIAHEGYQPIEYGAPKKVLVDAGFNIITISDMPGIATGKDGSITTVDVTIDGVDIFKLDALYLIGGPGAFEHLDTESVYTFVQRFVATGKPYGAICISPRVLANAGVLQGKRATGWNEDRKLSEIFSMHGATYTGTHIEQDGNVITADGPASGEEFGNAIKEMLKSEE